MSHSPESPSEPRPQRAELELLEREFFEQRRGMHSSLLAAATTACMLTIVIDVLLDDATGVGGLVLGIAELAFCASALMSLRQSEARRAEIARLLADQPVTLHLATHVRPRASSDALSLLARAAFALGLLLVVGASLLLF